jgi:hypothetical protein
MLASAVLVGDVLGLAAVWVALAETLLVAAAAYCNVTFLHAVVEEARRCCARRTWRRRLPATAG